MANQKYNIVSMILHWLIFGLLVWNIAIGWGLEDMDKAAKLAAIQTHKSLGFTILLLVIFRLAWRHIAKPPALPSTMSARDVKIAGLTHMAVYAIMLGVPLLGWFMISTSSYKFPTMFWGMFQWPLLPLSGQSFSKPLHEITEFAHGKLVWVGIILVILHVAAAIKHQIIDKDGVLGRMIPFIK